MLTQEELQEVVYKREYPKSLPRDRYVKKISDWMSRKEIIVIKGIRRCGKTYIMYQLIKKLPKENTFYINFDDFRLDKHLSIELLEQLLKLRDKNKKAYYFLDEVQRIEGFEKWLRTYYDQEINVKFVIGGSNISLLSPILGAVLTGRHITFEISPLSYSEFKDFSKDPFEAYLNYGGFPEVVLEPDLDKKKDMLRQYIIDIVARDIIGLKNIENPRQIQALVNFFLANPGIRISANKLASQLGVHKDTAQKYISYVIDTFLIFEVPYFSYSAKTKYIGARASKFYLVDNGLFTVSSIKLNKGMLYENIIAKHLKKMGKEVMYWADKSEIDFIFEKTALQVTSAANIPKREISAFEDFSKTYSGFTKIIVYADEIKEENGIKFIPIKQFLKQD
ncbi:MAG: ATP-binding protein [Nanoarchaeota archaeon]|nr:ATP-binding protein [Nanoarchaeota archaeon]MBU1005347.1 ATP-binding protein [Nanoarchaeota archaeon]MBU1946097.1 ATP-binding protein [Nanoarchaeota archaeon]